MQKSLSFICGVDRRMRLQVKIKRVQFEKLGELVKVVIFEA